MVPLSSPLLHFAEKKPWAHVSFHHRYAAEVLADTKSFQEKLTKEMSEWIEKHYDDESVPEVRLSECEVHTALFNLSRKEKLGKEGWSPPWEVSALLSSQEKNNSIKRELLNKDCDIKSFLGLRLKVHRTTSPPLQGHQGRWSVLQEGSLSKCLSIFITK